MTKYTPDQHCPLEFPVMMEMFCSCTVHYGSQEPHVATEYFSRAQCTRETEVLIVFCSHLFKFKFEQLYVTSSYCIGQCSSRTIQGS